MQREPEFYTGISGCFRVCSKQHKRVDLTLHRVITCTPGHTIFYGCIYDGCTGECLDDVSVSVKYNDCRYTEYTGTDGWFCFELPCCAGTVSITLCKRGYLRRYIHNYVIAENCKNNFVLYETY